MRLLLFATLLAAVLFFVYADPVLHLPGKIEDLPAHLENLPAHHRARRAACDLFSALNVASSICAAHCLYLGYKGGYCDSKLVCVCR